MMTSPLEAMRQAFGLNERPNFPPRYNIAPTQEVLIVRLAPDGTGRVLARAHWGLIPVWIKDRAQAKRMAGRTFNARAETVQSLNSFRAAYRARRCLVPANGFYEWPKLDGERQQQPYLVHMPDMAPYAYAGLWETWRDPQADETVHSCTIITTTPNEFMRSMQHERMPVILAPDDYDRWLDPGAADGSTLLRPCPNDWLRSYRVSARVNNWRNDDPGCIEPLTG